MDEIFGIAAFRSRQQVMKFESALRRAGLPVSVISTPRDVSVGCGLSVRFEETHFSDVLAVYDRLRPTNLIGFYLVTRIAGGRTICEPMGTRPRS